jgi:hypothetical protein
MRQSAIEKNQTAIKRLVQWLEFPLALVFPQVSLELVFLRSWL